MAALRSPTNAVTLRTIAARFSAASGLDGFATPSATDEVRVVVFHREHFIVRFDWIFNRVCPTGEEYVQSHAFGGNFDVPRVFNHDHRVGVRVEIVSVDDGFFDFAILGVGLVLFELHPGW